MERIFQNQQTVKNLKKKTANVNKVEEKATFDCL